MARRWAPVVTLLLAASLLAPPAEATEKLLAVLPLDVRHTAGRMTKDDEASLEEMLRDLASNSLPGWTVMTGATTVQLLEDNGIDPTKCSDSSCQLQTARQIEADKFFTGTAQYVDGEYTVSIRIIDTKTGRILSAARVLGKNTLAVEAAFQKQAPEFFARAGLVGASAAPAPAPDGGTTLTAVAVAAAGGTVKDPRTGLTWQRQVPGPSYGWEDAKAYCAGLSLAGGGWRLPTIDELKGLADSHLLPNSPVDWFWSSSRHLYFTGSWLEVGFHGGYQHGWGVGSGANRVRCVR